VPLSLSLSLYLYLSRSRKSTPAKLVDPHSRRARRQTRGWSRDSSQPRRSIPRSSSATLKQSSILLALTRLTGDIQQRERLEAISPAALSALVTFFCEISAISPRYLRDTRVERCLISGILPRVKGAARLLICRSDIRSKADRDDIRSRGWILLSLRTIHHGLPLARCSQGLSRAIRSEGSQITLASRARGFALIDKVLH